MGNIITTAGDKNVEIKVNRPSWDAMYSSYPGENILGPSFYPMVSKAYDKLVNDPVAGVNWKNTCATRMSYALNRSGIKLPQTSGSIKGDDGYNYWFRVTELSDYLKKRFKGADFEHSFDLVEYPLTQEKINARANDVYVNFLSQITGKKGIITFDVYGWTDATGHFTLWDGTDLVFVGNPSYNDSSLASYYFWFARNAKDRNGNDIVIQTKYMAFWELK